MNLLLSNSLSALLLLIGLHMESAAVQSYPVIQTPSSLNVVEGTNLRMECKIELNTTIWFVEWHVNKTGGNKKLENTSSIVTDIENKWSRLTLTRADMTDSGIYRCEVGSTEMSNVFSNGTQVNVSELTNLMVNQTPGRIDGKEGANVTIECSFKTVSNYSTMYVIWSKDEKKLTRERDSLTMIQDLENGTASLTLKNMKEDDSGSYMCEVGSRSRNLTGSGTPFQVVITGREKKRRNNTNAGQTDSMKDGPGMVAGIGAGVGAGVGIILLALLIGFVWRRKHTSQGAPLATSEPEGVSAEQTRTQHPPLASQASDVMYANLRFNKRDVKPDAEVIYAEVKVGRK